MPGCLLKGGPHLLVMSFRPLVPGPTPLGRGECEFECPGMEEGAEPLPPLWGVCSPLIQ